MFLGGCALEAVSPLWRNEYKEVEEEEELTEEEKMIESSAPRTLMSIRQLSMHGLGEEQLKSKFKVALNRMSISWTLSLDKYIHINFLQISLRLFRILRQLLKE